ncbi:unnamed protein product, partial [Laminaria digitata]
RANEFPLGCVAPITIMWSSPNPLAERSSAAGAEMEGEEEEGGGVSEEVRRVWLWVHPAAAKEALREIRKACSLEGAPWVGNIEVGPVAGGLCRLRVRGARSREVLQQVLRPAVSGDPTAPSPGASGDDDVLMSSTLPAARGDQARYDEEERRVLAGKGVGDAFRGAGHAMREEASQEQGSSDSPNPSSTETEGLRFEDAARDNASLWETLETPSAMLRGGGGGRSGDNPRHQQQQQLSPGAVLAINALDPREIPPSQSRQKKRHALPAAPAPTASPPSAPPRFGAEPRESEEGDAGDAKIVGGSSDRRREAGRGKRRGPTECELQIAATALAAAATTAATAAAVPATEAAAATAAEMAVAAVGMEQVEVEARFHPRLPPVSPLWDPDARALSAELAEARPDHVLNEARRRERHARAAAARDGSAIAAFKAPAKGRNVKTAGAKGDDTGGAAGGAAVVGGGFGGGFAPVLLVSSPGVTTAAQKI